ncbi:hypothetical protein KW798_02010 [Candidatus Parcubacteria bacterium]|nr:hypothetical protein [Candidatus Parcubacteria bacterium]
MNKNLIIFAIIVAVLLGVAGYWHNNQKPASTAYTPQDEPSGNPVVADQSKEDPYDVLIEYTTDGFTPKDVIIKQGQRVRFINSTDEDTWPASGVHPTHSIYPGKNANDCLGSEFDACRGLHKGEYFDYTFNYLGEWRFHDHLHASKTGSVTVEE